MSRSLPEYLAWLPYVVDPYVYVTGDLSILDECVPFIAMRSLEDHEHEVYDLPQESGEKADVYEHCCRALERACIVRTHGLPLIGIGDWNDGMSRVGVDGKGESLWLAWFLIETLRAFAMHASERGDEAGARIMLDRADAYVTASRGRTEWFAGRLPPPSPQSRSRRFAYYLLLGPARETVFSAATDLRMTAEGTALLRFKT